MGWDGGENARHREAMSKSDSIIKSNNKTAMQFWIAICIAIASFIVSVIALLK